MQNRSFAFGEPLLQEEFPRRVVRGGIASNLLCLVSCLSVALFVSWQICTWTAPSDLLLLEDHSKTSKDLLPEDCSNTTRLMLPWRGMDEQIVVVADSQSANEVALRFLDGDVVVGLDTEWNTAREISVLQLAGKYGCVVLLVPEVDLQKCPFILALLSDPAIVKCGVGIMHDATLLRKHTGSDVRSCCDLTMLATREGHLRASQPCGLARLTKILLDVDLPKDAETRTSNWGLRPLSAHRIHYAARDALAGRDCAVALREQYMGNEKSFKHWCGDLLDRLPKVRKSVGGDSNLSNIKQLEKCPFYSRSRRFATTRILDLNNRTILHMRDQRAQTLLRRGLASRTERDGSEAIRLHFNPSDNYDYVGVDRAEGNACVGCGSSGTARFYVVPKIFFMHLPEQCKRYNCHDVVLLCPACRATAEPLQLARVQKLFSCHGAVKKGMHYCNENALNSEQVAAKRAAGTLLLPLGRKGNLPVAKELELVNIVAEYLDMNASDVRREHLEQVMRLEDKDPSPSERVCAAATVIASALRKFLRDWRQLFLSALRPRFLAEGWAVDTGLADRFVPSVAASMEWPGDWRCRRCGFHCFGRNEYCRRCGMGQRQENVGLSRRLGPPQVPQSQRPLSQEIRLHARKDHTMMNSVKLLAPHQGSTVGS